MITAIDNYTTESMETLTNIESNLENANSSVAQYKTEVTTKVQHINGNFYRPFYRFLPYQNLNRLFQNQRQSQMAS